MSKRHVALGLPTAKLFWVLSCQAQGYSWAIPSSAQAKASLGAWTAAQRKHVKRHVALGLSALMREPKCPVSQYDFFHTNSSFLKFINDDNNIYTLISFNENNNIYNTNNNIFSSNNIYYYKNNIIYNTKYNNILDMNTINYTKK